MLHLYRRHVKACPHTSWTYRRCQCPITVKGTLAGASIYKALDTTSWEAAQTIIGGWIKAGQIGQIVDEAPGVAAAVEAYLQDAIDRELTPETTKKYRTLLRGRLLVWCRHEGYEWLPSLTLDRLTQFRRTWPDAPISKQKNQERLRAFFSWCRARGWVTANPAEGLSPVRVEDCPTLPFTEEEMATILAAVDAKPLLKAYILTLRWSGLRISDVTDLQWQRLTDGKLRLYTQKTGTAVYIPLPPVCLSALEAVRTPGETYIFRTGDQKVRSAISNWQKKLKTLFDRLKLDGAHAHRFRDTFAVELLLKGVDIVDVSVLLGHASVKVTEKHYSAWVAARQRRLEAAVAKTWQQPSDDKSAPDDSSSTPHHTSQIPPEVVQETHDPQSGRCETPLRLVHGRNPSRTADTTDRSRHTA